MPLDLEDPKRRTVTYVEHRLDRITDRIESSLRPVFEVGQSVAETLIWLSGGGIVATVSLTQVFLGKDVEASAGFLLLLGWALLVVTLCLSFFSVTHFITAYSGPYNIEARKKDVREVVREVYDEDHPGPIIDGKIEEVWREAWEEPVDALHTQTKLFKISVVTFVLGLVVLMVFASLNLPFPLWVL